MVQNTLHLDRASVIEARSNTVPETAAKNGPTCEQEHGRQLSLTRRNARASAPAGSTLSGVPKPGTTGGPRLQESCAGRAPWGRQDAQARRGAKAAALLPGRGDRVISLRPTFYGHFVGA
jgi:hypothetical protein